MKNNVFFTVFLSKRLVGSYVGNRHDAAEALDIAAAGKVKTLYKILPLGDLPEVYCGWPSTMIVVLTNVKLKFCIALQHRCMKAS